MRKKALIDRQQPFRFDCPRQAIKRPRVKVPSLVIHSAHYGIWRMHKHAHDQATRGTTRQMQRRALLHPQMFHQPPFGEKVCRQLHTTSKTRPHHRWPDAAEKSSYTFGAKDLREPVPGVAVLVLRAYGKKWRERLQAGFHQEERGAGCCAYYTARGTAEDVDG